MTDGGTETDEKVPNSKVARVLREYDLVGLSEELVRRWTAEGEARRSLRQLADDVNRELVRVTMEDAGMTILDGDVPNTYRLLTDDDVSAGMRTEAETTLQREGVDVERLRSDFVSHQAVHTYLTKRRGAESPDTPSDEESVERGAETIRRLRSRTTAVSEKTLRTLRDTDRISLGSFDVLVDVRLFCEDCGKQYDAVELLEAGGCDCGNEKKE